MNGNVDNVDSEGNIILFELTDDNENENVELKEIDIDNNNNLVENKEVNNKLKGTNKSIDRNELFDDEFLELFNDVDDNINNIRNANFLSDELDFDNLSMKSDDLSSSELNVVNINANDKGNGKFEVVVTVSVPLGDGKVENFNVTFHDIRANSKEEATQKAKAKVASPSNTLIKTLQLGVTKITHGKAQKVTYDGTTKEIIIDKKKVRKTYSFDSIKSPSSKRAMYETIKNIQNTKNPLPEPLKKSWVKMDHNNELDANDMNTISNWYNNNGTWFEFKDNKWQEWSEANNNNNSLNATPPKHTPYHTRQNDQKISVKEWKNIQGKIDKWKKQETTYYKVADYSHNINTSSFTTHSKGINKKSTDPTKNVKKASKVKNSSKADNYKTLGKILDDINKEVANTKSLDQAIKNVKNSNNYPLLKNVNNESDLKNLYYNLGGKPSDIEFRAGQNLDQELNNLESDFNFRQSIKQQGEKLKNLAKEECIYFYHSNLTKNSGFLGNYELCMSGIEVNCNGKKLTFLNSEAAYMAKKWEGLTIKLNGQTMDASEAFEGLSGEEVSLMKNKLEDLTGQHTNRFDKDGNPDYGANDRIMREVLKAKFDQNPDLKYLLLCTGDAYLAEHDLGARSNPDKRWAGGSDGSGENKLGTLLMELRAEYTGSTYNIKKKNGKGIDKTKVLMSKLCTAGGQKYSIDMQNKLANHPNRKTSTDLKEQEVPQKFQNLRGVGTFERKGKFVTKKLETIDWNVPEVQNILKYTL